MIHHLMAAERDTRSLLDVDGEPEAIGNGLRSRLNCETVVLTRGSDGPYDRRYGSLPTTSV